MSQDPKNEIYEFVKINFGKIITILLIIHILIGFCFLLHNHIKSIKEKYRNEIRTEDKKYRINFIHFDD